MYGFRPHIPMCPPYQRRVSGWDNQEGVYCAMLWRIPRVSTHLLLRLRIDSLTKQQRGQIVCDEPLITVDRQMGLNIVHPDGKVKFTSPQITTTQIGWNSHQRRYLTGCSTTQRQIPVYYIVRGPWSPKHAIFISYFIQVNPSQEDVSSSPYS